MALDPRLNAFRDDLADERLIGRVEARRFAAGEPGHVTVGRAPVRRRAQPAAAIDTYYHYGEDVQVFARADGYAWCQSRFDRYVGYVAENTIAIGAGAAATHHVATMGSYLYGAPDLREEPVDFLPRHSAVRVVETGLVTRGTEYARLGGGGFLPLCCLSQQPPRSLDLVAAARLYLGCPYLWGGRSILGLDCSGLVQMAFCDIGVAVLRDTDMQRETIGAAVAAQGESDLRRGDLLFLPGHVLIYDGAGAVIHADGARMMVVEEKFAGFCKARAIETARFIVRRYPETAASSIAGTFISPR